MNPVPFTTLAAAMDFVVGDRNYPLSELFMKGGFIMWPLLLLSIAGVVVLVMCCFSTRASAVLPTKLVEQAESFIRKRDYTGLSILCKNGDSCYARVMLTVANFMLRNPSAQFEEVREIASAEGGRQAGFLSRQISWLSDIGAVAPMLGLLGTVVGMMKTFFEIANGDFSGGKQRIDMAGGVAEALITTAGGLMLGIPAILAYVYFRSRVHKRVGDLEAAVTHSVSVVATQLQKPRAGAAGAFHEEELPKVPVDRSSMPRMGASTFAWRMAQSRLSMGWSAGKVPGLAVAEYQRPFRYMPNSCLARGA